jgi:hypothetical protein
MQMLKHSTSVPPARDGGRATIFPPLALSKKAREHLMFSQPFDEIAMYMAKAFCAFFKHFSLLTILKVQFNQLEICSGLGSLSCWSYSTMSWYRFRAFFETHSLNWSSTSIEANFFYISVSPMMSSTLLVISSETHFWNSSSRWSSNLFLTCMATEIPSQWSSMKNRSSKSLYFSCNLVHWPFSKSNSPSKSRMFCLQGLHHLRFGQFLQFFIIYCLQFINFSLQLLYATVEAFNLLFQSLYPMLVCMMELIEVIVFRIQMSIQHVIVFHRNTFSIPQWLHLVIILIWVLHCNIDFSTTVFYFFYTGWFPLASTTQFVVLDSDSYPLVL